MSSNSPFPHSPSTARGQSPDKVYGPPQEAVYPHLQLIDSFIYIYLFNTVCQIATPKQSYNRQTVSCGFEWRHVDELRCQNFILCHRHLLEAGCYWLERLVKESNVDWLTLKCFLTVMLYEMDSMAWVYSISILHIVLLTSAYCITSLLSLIYKYINILLTVLWFLCHIVWLWM